MVVVEGILPTAEDVRDHSRRIGRRNFIRIGAGAAALATLSIVKGEKLFVERSQNIKSSPEKSSGLKPLDELAVPGVNLITNFNFQEAFAEVDSQSKTPYQRPQFWIPSDFKQSRYWQGLGPEGKSGCVEVDATTKSSWTTENPIAVERGFYFLAFNLKINKGDNQEVSGIRHKISIIPIDSSGNKKLPLFTDWSAKTNMLLNEWNNIEGKIPLEITEPQQVVIELSGFDMNPESYDFGKHKTVRFSNINLRRMINPGEPDYPRDFRNKPQSA